MTRLAVEVLPDRVTPAVLDIVAGALTFTGGAAENTLTVTVAGSPVLVYSFKDTTDTITVAAGAKAVGYRGSGTHAVSGPASAVASITIDADAGTNQVNVQSVTDPVLIDGGSGTTVVVVGSDAPIGVGGTAGIGAGVSLTAGANTSLLVAGVSDATRPGTVTIDGTGVHGFCVGGADIQVAGTLTNLTVRGSNSPSLAEAFDVGGPPAASFRLDTLAGNDAVTISGDTTGDVYLGPGDDTLTVLAGVTLAGDVHTGTGTDIVNANAFGYGTVTGSIGP